MIRPTSKERLTKFADKEIEDACRHDHTRMDKNIIHAVSNPRSIAGVVSQQEKVEKTTRDNGSRDCGQGTVVQAYITVNLLPPDDLIAGMHIHSNVTCKK